MLTAPRPSRGIDSAAAQSPAGGWCSSNLHGCPCGFAGTSERTCRCAPLMPERYQRRVSGPLRDRIDLWIAMPRVAPLAIVRADEPEGSASVAARIASARAVATDTRSGELNGRLTGRPLRAACRLTRATERHVVGLAELERASGRGTERILRVARTIADLPGAEAVSELHLD